MQLFAVYNSDGCECKFLLAIFSDRVVAEQYKDFVILAERTSMAGWDWDKEAEELHMQFFIITVEPIVVDEPISEYEKGWKWSGEQNWWYC